MTQRFAQHRKAKHSLGTSCASAWLGVCMLGFGFSTGCQPNPSGEMADLLPSELQAVPGKLAAFETAPEKQGSNQVLAQGRLQPARGFIRMAALPGDRIDAILVKPGDRVKQQQPLVLLQSFRLRSIELETAQLKLDEAKAAHQAKQQEADLGIQAAELKLQAAKHTKDQAEAQYRLAKKSNAQLESLQRQVDSLKELREAPLTRAAIGSIELESKQNEIIKVSSLYEQSMLAAEQAIEMARLQTDQAEKGVTAAQQARKLVDDASPLGSLEKQMELLQLQLEQAKMNSPIDGVVTQVNGEVGERTAQLPIVELADLSAMVCVAEVHESDVGKVSIGDSATLTSSALKRTLRGHVLRIDRTVGAAQMRAPNPMSRSDFRSVSVWIEVVPEDVEAAAERLQLQVEVKITTSR